jgi:hypothetical protein
MQSEDFRVAFLKGQAPAWEIWCDLWIRLAMSFGSPNIAPPANVCFFPRSSTFTTVGEYAESDFDNRIDSNVTVTKI